jgi:hypothetical protein
MSRLSDASREYIAVGGLGGLRINEELFTLSCTLFMDNSVNLIPGQQYRVTQSFTDFDKIIHPVGESWIYIGTNFLPYDDGLTLHIKKEGIPHELICRLQWREEEQAHIIENFRDFVELVG